MNVRDDNKTRHIHDFALCTSLSQPRWHIAQGNFLRGADLDPFLALSLFTELLKVSGTSDVTNLTTLVQLTAQCTRSHGQNPPTKSSQVL